METFGKPSSKITSFTFQNKETKNVINLSYIHNDYGTSAGDSSQNLPVTLFIHGLDSSSHTWRNILSSIETSSAYAIDLRGNGNSALGDRKTFSIDAVVDDVKELVDQKIRKKPIVLVGHSMGARVASCYASKYPNDVCSLVMEDMDIRPRDFRTNPITMNDMTKVYGFQKCHETLDRLVHALTDCGYPKSMVDKWIQDGRIRSITVKGVNDSKEDQNSARFWTDVNPEMRLLAYKHIMSTTCGEDSWRNIASQKGVDFKCHVMASGIDSQCSQQSLELMQSIMKGRMVLHRFPNAGHSIHRTAKDEFLRIINEIVICNNAAN